MLTRFWSFNMSNTEFKNYDVMVVNLCQKFKTKPPICSRQRRGWCQVFKSYFSKWQEIDRRITTCSLGQVVLQRLKKWVECVPFSNTFTCMPLLKILYCLFICFPFFAPKSQQLRAFSCLQCANVSQWRYFSSFLQTISSFQNPQQSPNC